ncbi:LuxR family maltose regulon positive regulatory protein [Babesia caballi]|uniref:LuxR family maltose regulon positive regulatory protein n=1 Tax=Babesia caballi TaxID=5871 RepID=A0AAV4LR35_BABCB|nr:LuxR family maltose regulon positive regulatory protein [Babesia caballi]
MASKTRRVRELDREEQGHVLHVPRREREHNKRLAVQYSLPAPVLHEQPEALVAAVQLRVPLEVRRDADLHAQHVPRQRLHKHLKIQPRHQVYELVDCLAQFRLPAQLTQLYAAQIVVPVPPEVVALKLQHQLLRQRLELAQRQHHRPHAPVNHFAKVEELLRQLAPLVDERDFVQRPENAPRVLRDEGHLRDQRVALEVEPGNVALQQNRHLAGALLAAAADGYRHLFHQRRQLHLFLVAHRYVLELRARREDPQQVGHGQVRPHVIHVGLDRGRLQVVETRNPPQRRGLDPPVSAIIPHERVLVQLEQRRVSQRLQPHLEQLLVHRGRAILLVALVFIRRNHPIKTRLLAHPHGVVRVPQPRHRVLQRCHVPQHHLGVQQLRQAAHQLALDRQLLVVQRQVELELFVNRDDDALALLVELRPPCASHHLLHREGAQLRPAPLLRRVNLRALYDDGVRGQVDAPAERGRADQQLDVPVRKEVLDELPVGPRQAGVVDAEAVGQQLLELRSFNRLRLRRQNLARRAVAVQKHAEGVGLEGHVPDELRSARRLLPAVHEHEDLVLASILHHALVHDLVHGVVPLDGLFLLDADVPLLQSHRTVVVAEVKEAPIRVHPQELRDVRVVGHGRAQPDQPRPRFALPVVVQGPRDDRLEHGATLVVQQVNFINDDQLDSVLHTAPPRDHVPLLRRYDQQLRLHQLVPRQAHVAGELADVEAVGREALRERLRLLHHKRLHGRHVHDLEILHVQVPRLVPVPRHHAEHGKHGDVRLARSSRRADQHVLLEVLERDLRNHRLHGIERVHTRERRMRPLREVLDGLPLQVLRRLQRVDNDLVVRLVLHTFGLRRKHNLGVCHVLGPILEGLRLQVNHLRLVTGARSLYLRCLWQYALLVNIL